MYLQQGGTDTRIQVAHMAHSWHLEGLKSGTKNPLFSANIRKLGKCEQEPKRVNQGVLYWVPGCKVGHMALVRLKVSGVGLEGVKVLR